MKFYYLLLAALVSLSFCASAQTNYKPAYIVTSAGDTIRGSMSYKEWQGNPKQVEFLKTKTGSPVKYQVKDIRAYGFPEAGEVYEKHFVKISKSAASINKAGVGLDTSYRTDTVFLMLLVRGVPLSLYRYNDAVKTHFYYSSGAATPVELIYSNYYNVNDPSKLENYKRYVIQLIQLAQENNKYTDKFAQYINEADYSTTALTRVIDKINNPGNITVVKKGGSELVRFFAGVGVNRSVFKYTDTKNSVLTRTMPLSTGKFNASYYPKIDFGAEMFINRNTRNLSFRIEVGLTGASSDVEAVNKDVVSQNDYTTHGTFKQYTASVSPTVLYNIYNQDNFKFFVSAGVIVNFSSYNNQKYIEKWQSPPITTETEGYPEMNKVWAQYPIKAGVVLGKKIEIYGAYMLPVVLTRYSNFNVREYSIHAGVHYLFGKTGK